MTLSTTDSRQTYIGTGIVGPYAFDFPIFAATDLLITTEDLTGVEHTLAFPADYTVSGVGATNGGSISLTTALISGWMLIIRRVVSLTQQTDLRNQGTFFPEVHENTFDYLTMIDQQQQDEIDRSLKFAESIDLESVSPTIPAPAPLEVLAWNSSGTALENLPLSQGAVALPGQGRTTASLTTYLVNNAIFNVLDYVVGGAINTGINDPCAAIQAAMNAAEAAGGGIVWCPAGTYLFQNPLGTYKIFIRPRNNVWLRGDGPGTIFKAAAGLNTLDSSLGFNFIRHVLGDEAGRTSVTNFWVSDITFDHNGQNNLIAVGNTSKDNVAVGVQVGTNLRVERCVFKNNAGRQTLSFGNNVSPQSCSQVYLLDNVFNEMGGSVTGNIHSTDHSSIYIQASNSEVSRNTFVNANAPFNNTALEVHCIDTNVSQNAVQNYFVMFNLVATIADFRRVTVSQNTGSGLQIGFNLWQLNPYVFDDVQIVNNTMRQASTSTNNFVLMSNVVNGITSIDFLHNRFSSAMAVNQAPVLACFEIGLATAFTIKGNTIKNFPGRAIEYSTPTAGASIIIEDNLIADCGTTTTSGNKQGIALNSLTTIGYLSIQRNKIENIAATYMTSGIIGNAPVTQGQMKLNFVIGIATAFGGIPASLLVDYNVKEWGAIGNGTVDDTAALQAAITAAGAASGLSGGQVYIPPGVYKTTAPLTVPQLVSIIGYAPEVTEIQPNGCNGFNFSVSAGAGPVKFGGFLIFGVGTITSNIAVNIPGDTTLTGKVSGVDFSNLQINGFNTGIFARTAWYCSFREIQIRNCWNAFVIHGLSVGLELCEVRGILGTATGSGNSTGLTVSRDITGYTAGTQVPQGIHVRGGGFNGFAIGMYHEYVLYATYTDCDFDLSTLYAVQQLSNAGGVTWKGCWFGIVGTGAGMGFNQQAIASRDSGFTSIKNCSFINTSTNVGCNGFNGAAQQSNLLIEGCVFSGWTNLDIVVPNGGVHNRIINNRCESSATTNSIFENGTGIDLQCYGNETVNANHTAASGLQMHTSQLTLGNGAAAAAGTLTNAPTAGNPTKWIPINDNGTVRYIPAW